MKETPPSLARAIAIVSLETDCMMAETRGMDMVMADSSPFLNLTRGVFRETLLGTQSALV